MKHILILLLSLCPALGFAQGENDNWYFGSFAGVNFAAPGSPVALSNSQMSSLEACGSASDASGNLLFYTNGSAVWNRQHQVMPNGSGLTGHPSTQQLAIVKHPGNPNQYYIFTGGLNNGTISIAYSIVDMSLGSPGPNGPLGDVVSGAKNILVTDQLGNTFTTEAITVVPSPFNTFWVLIPNSKKLYSYRVDNSGFINGAPVISGLVFTDTLMAYNHFGIKASPKLNISPYFSHYLCVSSWANPNYTNKVISFNSITGQTTQDYAMSINSVSSYQPEFNRDASVLYLGYNKMYAVDMLGSTPLSVNYMQFYDFGFGGACGSIQRNKHNDIYVSVLNSNYLAKINNPDAYGPGISLDPGNIYLGTNPISTPSALLGLPQLLPMKDNSGYPCLPNLVLTHPETYFLFTYQVQKDIVTKDQYTVFPRQNITMKAGTNVTLLPNTYIMKWSRYFATIDGCNPHLKPAGDDRKEVNIAFSLDQGAEQGSDITIYPNPAATDVNIDTRHEKLLYWELYDMSGRFVMRGSNNKIKVEGLAKQTYLLRISINQGKNVCRPLVVR